MPTREGDMRSWAFDRTASKFLDVYEWKGSKDNVPAAGFGVAGVVRAEGAGNLIGARVLLGDQCDTAAAVGSMSVDVGRSAAGVAASAATSLTAPALLVFATDAIATEGVWNNFVLSAAGSARVAAGDILVAMITHTGGGAPTGCENTIVQFLVEPDA